MGRIGRLPGILVSRLRTLLVVLSIFWETVRRPMNCLAGCGWCLGPENHMLTTRLGIDARTRAQRLEVCRITESDRVVLKSLGPVFRPSMGKIVDAFYEHVGRIPGALAVISSAGSSVDRLKKTNPTYFETMFRGEFDDDYFESRLVIGKVHAMIGLEPRFYYAAMSTYIDEMLPLLSQHFRLSPKKATEAAVCLMKAFNLDQSLIMEAYIEFVFSAELKEVISASSEIAESLARSSSQLSGASEASGRSVAELASVSEQIAMAATSQAEAGQQAAQSTSHLSDASESIGQGSERQAAAVTDAHRAITQVLQSVNDMSGDAGAWEEIREQIVVIDRVRKTVQSTADRVEQMNSSSDQIGRIVQTIEDIAAQTNLLALNAAIEAARAGEAGRGFAVVADEVRKLAEHSASATKEITSLIVAVQAGSRDVAEAMRTTLSDVEDAASVTLQATGCLEKIAGSSSVAARASTEVTRAMEVVEDVTLSNDGIVRSIKTAVAEMDHMIDQIAAISEENSASAEEMSASAQQMSAQVEELVAGVQDLDAQIMSLLAVVRRGEAFLAKFNQAEPGASKAA